MQATQYDVADPIFQAKLDMLNYEYSSSCKPSDNCLHMIECDPRQTTVNELYTLYNQDTPPNADPRLYHLGRYSLATTGFQGTSVNIGEIHVTYQVRLLKPKLFTTLGSNATYLQQKIGNDTGAAFTDDRVFPDPVAFPGAFFINSFNNDQFFVDSTTITFPRSSGFVYYRIELQWVGSGPVVGAIGVLSITNGTITVNNNSLPVLATERVFLNMAVTINPTSTNAVLTAGAGFTLPTGNQSLILRIFQVSPDTIHNL